MLPVSLIFTDYWKDYNDLQKYYEHDTVNHSENYADPALMHALIEWKVLRTVFNILFQQKREFKDILHLSMFIWRRINRN